MKRIGFTPSGLNLELSEIADHYDVVSSSMTIFYAEDSPSFLSRHAFSMPAQILSDYRKAQRELEISICLTILASLEAKFRLDYLQRVDSKLKDPLSRAYMKLYGRHKNKIGFDDLLDAWKRYAPSSIVYVRELKGALAFRHWLAHGRYWEPKLARVHGYTDIYRLADDVITNFPFVSAQ
ncbi:hypothetical protein [Pseudomonas sp. MWU318]|uniref:hypothetical protein n=1 Tax=Pseudomonas sp. MWU318 TaxID=2802569 RepID=UPI0019260891|nr:hypothetical protein [Pseudomonas sp. MWU318]